MTFGPNVWCDKHVNCFTAFQRRAVEWTLLLNPATTRPARMMAYLEQTHPLSFHPPRIVTAVTRTYLSSLCAKPWSAFVALLLNAFPVCACHIEPPDAAGPLTVEVG